MNVINSTLSNNTVTVSGATGINGSNGGGIYSYGTGIVTVTSSTLSNNSATADGSGDNALTSSDGGGIYCRSGIMNMINSTLAGNVATASGSSGSNSGSGGAIFSFSATLFVT